MRPEGCYQISGGRAFPRAEKSKSKDPHMRLYLMCLGNEEEASVPGAG